MAAPLPRAVLEARFPGRFHTVEGASFDARAGAVLARRRVMFGPLILLYTLSSEFMTQFLSGYVAWLRKG